MRRRVTRVEGFLFPAPYQFEEQTSAETLVANQLVRSRNGGGRSTSDPHDVRDGAPYEVLTVASMVEWETVAPEERRLVAAVIYNRLDLDMPLGIDATLRYGPGIPGTRPLTKAHLASNSPYNTRRFRGLPPTPIGNPGLASIRAAANPASVDYLYYVRKPDKIHHFFTADDEEFCRKGSRVRLQLLNPRAKPDGLIVTDEFVPVCRLYLRTDPQAPRRHREASLTSAGIKNPTIHDALVDLLGKPTTECDALCIPTALYGHPHAGPRQAWRCISGEETGTPTVGVGWKSMGVLSSPPCRASMPSSGSPSSGRRTSARRGGDATYLCHWMRQSGLEYLLATLPEMVWVGVSAGSMVMTPRIGDDFVTWPSAPDDRTLGIVDFSIFPHLIALTCRGTRSRPQRNGPPACQAPRTRSTTRPRSRWSTVPSRSSPRGTGSCSRSRTVPSPLFKKKKKSSGPMMLVSGAVR